MKERKEHENYILALSQRAKAAAVELRTVYSEQKNKAIATLADLLDKNRSRIQEQNNLDVTAAKKNNLSMAMIDRLVLSDVAIDSIIASLQTICSLPDPVGQVIEGKILSNGLQLNKVRIPLGVLAIIYESRPNVTIDVAALSLKSSNAILLRGGKEAIESNKILAFLFQQALEKNELPSHAVQLVEKTNRSLLPFLLQQKKYIDLVVPRGGSALIDFVNEHSLIPIVKHDNGICHLYIHSSADKQQAIDIALNSKTQRAGVCNAVETILIDKKFSAKEELLAALQTAGVLLRCDEKTKKAIKNIHFEELHQEGYGREYLALEVSVKVVENISEAIAHIQEFSSGHSEAIVAQDYPTIDNFQKQLDSAGIFINCSTRFHDGGQFGMGAEVGIATGKLHVRGPMGLQDLTTMKYIVQGQGQIRE